MKVKLKSTIDISSLELRELSAFDALKKDTIYDVLLIEMYEGKVKFIIVYDKDDFDGICGFSAELFDIIDGSIPNRWNIVRINDVLSIAPKNINYENFWSDLQEIFEDDLNFREKEKRYCFAFRNYVVEFAGFIDFKICKSEFRKIFNDYQDPSIKATGVDTQEDGYVVCPHCYNAEQASAEVGVIKCEKCQQEYNNPLAKICPSGIEVVDE